MSVSASRPWWKRKRWVAASCLLLVSAYPATHGPAVYAAKRGWVRVETYDFVYEPLFRLRAVLPESAEVWYGRYTAWWFRLACDGIGRDGS